MWSFSHECLKLLFALGRYDVGLFQKIEALTGVKMEEFESQQEAVLLLLERVGDAQRIATMQVSVAVDTFLPPL